MCVYIYIRFLTEIYHTFYEFFLLRLNWPTLMNAEVTICTSYFTQGRPETREHPRQVNNLAPLQTDVFKTFSA